MPSTEKRAMFPEMPATAARRALERRRHFRVDGRWTIPVEMVGAAGAELGFGATALNISMGGLLLEAEAANPWPDALTVTLPGGVGSVEATVRHLEGHGGSGRQPARLGLELVGMTLTQRGLWARFILAEAARLGQEAGLHAFAPV